jgi:hypothetical protein
LSTKLSHALALAREGFRVFPLAINGKEPAFESNWRKSATTDPARIADMWTCPVFDTPLDYNIGIALPPDIVVVDVDVRDGKPGAQSLALLEAIYDEMPPTVRVTTASGGHHHYLKTLRDSGTYPKELADGIDLKGHGGYVVAPGSSIGGNDYSLGEGAIGEIAMAPGWFSDLPATRRRDDRDGMGSERLAPVVELDDLHAVKRAAEWLLTAPEAVEGDGGDNLTIRTINHVGDFGISERVALELIEDNWNERCVPPWDHDDLREKVRSAYKSRQRPLGVVSPEAEFEAVPVAGTTEAKPRGRLFWKRFEEASQNTIPDELVEGWIDVGAMSVWYGNSGAGKTFILLSVAHAIGAGLPWNGHKTAKGPVVYVAAEGGHSIETRLMALRREMGESELAFIPCPVDLLHEGADTKPLIKLIKEIEVAYGHPPKLIVIDTLSRAIAGGNENASDDMGAFVKNLDALRAASKAHVAIVHHKGKNEAAGARGHSLLRAATDTEVEIIEGKINATKQRDRELRSPTSFRLKNVVVGERADGSPLSSCVVEWIGAAEFELNLSPEAKQMLEILEELVAAREDEIEAAGEPVNPDKPVKIEWSEWQKAVRLRMKGPRRNPITKQRLFKIRPELSDSGLVKRDAENQWFIVASPINRTQSD